MPRASWMSPHRTTAFTPGEVSSYYAVRVPNLKPARGKKRRGPCPIHRGTDANFVVAIETGLWYCHSQCLRGGDILTLEQALKGTDFRTALASVYAIVGRPVPDRTPFTPDEQWASQEDRRQAELERSEARYFADAVIILAEQALEELAPWQSERAHHTRLLKSLRLDAVAVYRGWRRDSPEGVSALIEAGWNHQRRVQQLLLNFVKAISTETETHAA